MTTNGAGPVGPGEACSCPPPTPSPRCRMGLGLNHQTGTVPWSAARAAITPHRVKAREERTEATTIWSSRVGERADKHLVSRHADRRGDLKTIRRVGEGAVERQERRLSGSSPTPVHSRPDRPGQVAGEGSPARAHPRQAVDRVPQPAPPTCPPKTWRPATRTCWRPSAGSGTSNPPWNYARCSTASSPHPRPRAAVLARPAAPPRAVVRIVAVDDDGQVHFSILSGSVAKNRHLLGRTVA